jgi:N-acyl homoserine lactone hydrolase
VTDDSNWTIEPLAFGEFPLSDKSSFTYLRNGGQQISLVAISFLLRCGDKKILVDTGPAANEEEHHPSHTVLRRKTNQGPITALAEVGLKPDDFDLVILTHLHYDHSYNLELFSHAKFIIQAEELRAAVSPVRSQASMYEFGMSGVVPPWMRVTSQFTIVRGDTEVAPGVEVLLLPGHTPGMQGVRVKTSEGYFVLASDLVSIYDNLGTGDDDWIVPGIHVDVALSERSIERIRAMDATILPSHDWRVVEHGVFGAGK